ncbi:hypothetical protein HDIA_3114 [Hartmannibacter diazotrophicus]|uniref:Aldose 1-epimerase n=1 Tax=Hartmannibacter diazotrophicus TaxID=1482074 RepID=A0A2C9DAM4_9HYPH|nr:DUF4432 family protein [Hartmannibacter diazotrophicus]SON56655.1 hypothetical protein HDIA_3114 [Hartmannibacter diazotrophicus]
MGVTTLRLHDGMFQANRRLLVRNGELSATAFRYASGVAGLEIDNGVGRIVLLPFQGQQIWDAEFLNRRLTMETWFDQPLPTRDYLATYGAFFLHCGGTAMGNPGPEDDHPLHGELPNMPYEIAELHFGSDEMGDWVELTGIGRERRAFSHHFEMRPRLRLRAGATEIEVSFDVENKAGSVLPFFYLGHINFRPVGGARIVDSLTDDRCQIVLRKPDLLDDTPAEIRAWHEALAADPSLHRRIGHAERVEPEMVMTLRPPAGADGWAEAQQQHPDGSADFVRHRPDELPFSIRWITRSSDRQAIGFSLPASAPPDGRNAGLTNGQAIMIAPRATFGARMRFGCKGAQ